MRNILTAGFILAFAAAAAAQNVKITPLGSHPGTTEPQPQSRRGRTEQACESAGPGAAAAGDAPSLPVQARRQPRPHRCTRSSPSGRPRAVPTRWPAS